MSEGQGGIGKQYSVGEQILSLETTLLIVEETSVRKRIADRLVQLRKFPMDTPSADVPFTDSVEQR